MIVKVNRLDYMLWHRDPSSWGTRGRRQAEYVAPSEAAQKGTGPKMLVQLLNSRERTEQYAAIFYQGDEAFSGLVEFAEKCKVTSAHFTAIGAVSRATLGWLDPHRKMCKEIPIKGRHEVIGMSGDIALYQESNDGRSG